MDTYRKKLPARGEYFKLFLVCSFPVHVWAYFNLLHVLPAILLQMSIWRILGVAAYVLGFALLESLFVFGLLCLASLLRPERLFKLAFIQVGSALVFATSIAATFIQLYDKWKITSLSYSHWVILWVLLGLSAFVLSVFELSRNLRIQKIFQSGIERLAVLSMVYLSMDILGLLVIFIRNIPVSV